MRVKPILLRTGALCCALLATIAFTAPALAQAMPDVPPPSRYQVDENGVDVARGTVTGTRTDLAIGAEGRAGLAFMRRFGYAQDGHNFDFGLFLSGGLTHASVGLDSIPFTQSGSTYTVADGSGATLVKSGTTYTLTLSDGTVVVYNYNIKDHNDLNRFSRATSITFPSGETLTLTWVSTTWCSNLQDGCAGGTWLTGVRLQAVSSSMGYQLHFNYGRADVLIPNHATGWRRLDGVTAINTTVESCSPSAHSCSLTNTWPTVSYSGSNVTDPEERTSTYAQNVSNQTYTIRRPSAGSPNVTYTHIVAYDRFPVTQVVRDGLTWSYNYSVSGNIATMVTTLPGSPTRTRTIVSDLTVGLPTSVTDEVGQTAVYAYDASGRLTRATAPEGNYVQYSYDARGNMTQAQYVAKSGSGSPTLTISASYPGSCSNPATCNQPSSTTDARGAVTDYTYDATHGGALTVTAPAPTGGAVRPQTRYTYSSLTQPGGGSVYRMTQVSECQTQSSCAGQADEVRTTIAYTQANLQPSSVTTASGNGSVTATSTIGYDYLARSITVDGPLSGTIDTARIRYNLAGQVIGTISADPDGAGALKHRAQRIAYNTDGQLSRVETGTVNSQSDADWTAFAALETVDVTYDSSARPIRQTLKGSDGAIHGVSDQSYDTAGRPECTAQRMNPSAWGTVTAACTLQTTGASGPDRITRQTYDAADRVTQVETGYGVSGVVADEVRTTYTDNGRVATVTDAEDNLTTYEYDGHDRLRNTRFPSPTTDGVSAPTSGAGADYEQLTYDAAGNVSTRRLRDGTSIVHGYDNLNRLTARDLPNTGWWEYDQSFAWDNLGRLVSAGNSVGHVQSWSYDALSRLTQETSNWYGAAASYAYDAAGRMTRLTWPDGLYVDYVYDTLGEMTAIRENGATSGAGVLAVYAYDDRGRRTSLTRGNGTVTSYSYDAVSRLSELVHNPSGTANDLTLGFAYNPAGQIASNTRSNDSYAWTGHYAVDRDYTADGLNQYTATGGITPTYDARGNLTSAGSITYAYTSDNLLATAPGAGLVYDALGRLLGETAAGTLLRYGPGSQVIAENDDTTNAIRRRYVPGPGVDEPLVWYEGAGTSDRRWLHADERGSVIAISNGSGAVTDINAYDESGIPASTNVGRFQYTGQQWIAELGMYHYRARIYSPTFGRFLQTDPIGYAGGMNIYAYVGNDPVNAVDPSGLATVYCTGTRLCKYHDGGGGSSPFGVGASGFTGALAGEFLGLNSGGSGGIVYVPGVPGPVTGSDGNGVAVTITASSPGFFIFAGGFGGHSGTAQETSGHYFRVPRRICTATRSRRCHIERVNTEACVLPGHISTRPIVSGSWYAVYASYSDLWPLGIVVTTQTGPFSFRNTTTFLHPLSGTIERIFSGDAAGNVNVTTIGQGAAATAFQDRVNQTRGPEIFQQQDELCGAIVGGL